MKRNWYGHNKRIKWKIDSIVNEVRRYLSMETMLLGFGKHVYKTYNPPNTMFEISNDLPELLLMLPTTCRDMYLRILVTMKRNPDPVLGCTTIMSFDIYREFMSESSYYRNKKLLMDKQLILKTSNPTVFVVNINYACKLSKPKLDEDMPTPDVSKPPDKSDPEDYDPRPLAF